MMHKKITFPSALWYVLIFLVLFSIVSIWFKSGASETIDVQAYTYLCTIRNENLTKFILFTSDLASIKAVIVVSIIFLILKIKGRIYGLDIALLSAFQHIVNIFAKSTFKRPRMEDLILVYEKSTSFPSGHTMTATVMYGFFIYLAYRYIKNKNLRVFAISSLCILILLIAFGRMYLGAHYFSDVLAALFLGIALLIIGIILSQWIRKNFNHEI